MELTFPGTTLSLWCVPPTLLVAASPGETPATPFLPPTSQQPTLHFVGHGPHF